ncbi:pyroglutamyl-peptidase 1-like [Penaeus indicus]|uniref:pyroglutamyl-peptidase 1-like n=1 Tax=Penaeus indicus TaxID=29960 RepID=UPI00300D3679
MEMVQPAQTETETDERPVIYVTGFEPFPPHAINASQRAVERLPETGVGEELGVRLVVEVMKVEYDYVSKVIPKRWKELSPKLVVHVGVSSQVCTLTLEQVSHNCGYNKKDNCNSVPYREVCVQGGEEMLQSEIRMDLVTCAINKDTKLKLSSAKSTDAGRYLCDFIYYTSLKQDKSRVAFIHVPVLEKSSEQDTAAAIAAAIKCMYGQVAERDSKAVEGECVVNGAQG